MGELVADSSIAHFVPLSLDVLTTGTIDLPDKRDL